MIKLAKSQPRGRPKKQRPVRYDPITSGMSDRDIGIALGVSRRKVALFRDVAEIGPEEFETLIESENFEFAQVRKLARTRAGKSTQYERACWNCGELQKVEAM
jgi:hypothetical protein